MADSPELAASGPVAIVVKSEGRTIDDAFEVMSIRTRAEINRIPEAVIVLLDGDPARQEFPVADSESFAPGKMISVEVGYGDGETSRIFTGIVTGMRVRVSQIRGNSVLEVTCRDKAIALVQGYKSLTYHKSKDSDVMRRIIADAGLEVSVEATAEAISQLIQSRCCDWDFLLARAEVNGQVAMAENGKVTVAKPDTSTAPVLSLTFGQDIIAFDAEIDALAQFAGYEAAAWDPKGQTLATSSETAGGAGLLGNLGPDKLASAIAGSKRFAASSGTVSNTLLSSDAQSRKQRSELAGVRGIVEFQGSAKASLGKMLEISGLSARFSGKGWISGVLHRIEDGNWTTEAMLGLDPERNIERLSGDAGGNRLDMLPGLGGLQIAKVVKLSEDPEALDRIQIKLPALKSASDETLLWARYAAPYASAGAGLMLLPEIDDEIVVAFLDEDPTAPVILGSLHNPTAARPASVADEKNNVKVFQSRSGLKITFDEEKKSIAVETPGKNSITLDDDAKSIKLTDQHGNSVALDSSGITLNSASDVTIKATGKVTISATADAKMSGANVELSGDVGLKATGGASAEVSAGGQTKISGAIVMIN
jgi:phage protein D